MKQTINHPEIGLIEVLTREGMRSVHYNISASKVQIVLPPHYISKVFPLKEERVKQILAEQQRMRESGNNDFLFTPESTYQANKFLLRFEQKSDIRYNFAAQRSQTELVVYYKNVKDFKNSQNQLIIKRLIAHFLKNDANIFLPKRLHELAEKHGFKYTQVRINSAQGRWGSCSTQKHICLSYNLMLLPDRLIDFVLVHELCHTIEMNHGPRFVQLMRNIFDDDYDVLKNEMSQHSTLRC